MIGKRNFYLIAVSLFIVIIYSSCSDKKEEKVQKQENGTEKDFSLRVLSYNIHHANPPSKEDFIDIASISNTIKSANPDVVALQEVDVDTERSGPGNQAQMIAEKLNMHYAFARAIDFQGGEYGVAILSKYPIKNEKIYRLPSVDGSNGEPRILLTGYVEIPGNGDFLFGSTHLDSQKSSKNRLLQIEELKKITNRNQSHSILIGGDFNATPGSQEIDVLDEVFTRTCSSCSPTFPATTPKKVIDFIVYKTGKGKESVKVESHTVIKDAYSSDHRPILSVFN